MSDSNSKFKNVFDTLKLASEICLNDDTPMLASEDFSLYESMSAVVIMDDKMDPCYGISCSTFDNFIQKSYNICGLSDEKSGCLLLQELFRREIAFLDGASLLESLHQGLHMWPDTWKLLDQSSSVSDKWISTYCQSTVASSTVFLRLVMNADIFEDEDFQFQSKVSSYLSQDEMELLSKETDALSTGMTNETVPGGKYIGYFFKYRTVLFQLHESIDDLISLSLTLPLSTRGSNSSHQQVSQMMKKLDDEGDAQQAEHDRQLRESLNQVYRISHVLHGIVSEMLACSEFSNVTENSSNEQKQFIENSFLKSLMNIQQTSPARTFPLLSFKDSLAYIQDMTQDLMCLCTSVNAMMFQTDNLDLDTLFQWFASMSKNKSNVLVRSYMIAVWTFLKPHMKVFLLNSCHSRGIPASFLSSSICEEWFRTSVSFLVWDTMKVLTVHRNKIQLKWDNLFSRWGNFMAETQYVDRAIAMQLLGDTGPVTVDQMNTQPWFNTWALNLTTSVMDVFMELYMELDLLNQAEFTSYYWYWDYMLSTKSFALKTLRELSNAMRSQLHEVDLNDAKEAVTKAKTSMNSNKKSKKAKETFNKAKAAYANLMSTPPPVPESYSTEEIFCILKGQIQKALFRFYMALDEGGVIKPADSPCSSPGLIFASRYRSLLVIGNPAPISYDDFLATKLSSSAELLEPLALVSSADAMLKTVKTLVTKAMSALPEDLNLHSAPSGAARWPRCVCRSGTPATAKLSASDKYPNSTLERSPETLVPCKSLYIQDLIALYEGLPKVSVTLSLASTRQLQRLSSPPPATTQKISYRLTLDRKFSDCFPVPAVEVIVKDK